MEVAQLIAETKAECSKTVNVGSYVLKVGYKEFSTPIGEVVVSLQITGTSGLGNKRPSSQVVFKLDGKRISRKNLEAKLEA